MIKFKRLLILTYTKKKTSSVLPKLLLVFILALVQFNSSSAEFGSIVDVGLAGDFYFTNESANNGQGYVNLLIQNTWSKSQIWVDLGAGGLVGDTASSYVKVPQFFYRWGEDGKFQFVVGRAVHEWSTLDDFWNMGLTQPIFEWDAANPQSQGLFGFFFRVPLIKKELQVNFFISPLYVPSQGASYDLVDGRISSSNPWFIGPGNNVSVSNQNIELNYDVDVPKITDIVIQESIGFQIGTPRNKKNFLYNGFYLNKPSNDLVLPFESPLNSSTVNGDVRVLPTVARHSVYGIDTGWNFGRYKSIFSWIGESEVKYSVPLGTTYPLLPKQDIYSFTQMARITRSQRLWLGYIHVDGDSLKVLGTNPGLDAFKFRNRFEKAIKLKWEGLLFKSLNQYRMRAAFSYQHSLLYDNVWLSADIKWSVYKGFEVTGRCDIFGGADKNLIEKDFISAYQNNDRCLIGGHYAF